MITLKIQYTTNEESKSKILEHIKNYNSVFNYLFNRFQDLGKALSTKESFEFINSLNNIFIDSYFKNGALYDVKQTFERFKDQKVIFGGKKLFFNRIKNLVSKEEFKIKKLRPLQVVGASANYGNCKFQILNDDEIFFKPCRKDHFFLNLRNVGKNYKRYLQALTLCQENKEIPITYKLDLNYVYITFDETKILPKIKEFKIKNKLKNRVFAIDLNPNYIGWSVVDWKSENMHKTIKSGVVSLKELNDCENSLNLSSEDSKRKYITNKSTRLFRLDTN